MSDEPQSASTKGITAAIIVILLLGVGYFLYNRSQPKPEMINLSPSPAAMIQDQVVSIDASASAKPGEQITITVLEQNNSRQAGVATITEIGNKIQVQLRIAGTSGNEPAHIHVGKCPQPAAVKYPLTDVVGGMSETTLDVPLSVLKSQLPLAINIHKAKEEIQKYTACGDIQ